MSYLNFNKAELVNLEYSLQREVLATNMSGSYANTTIVCCNTRKYHGLLVVPIKEFGNIKHILLSSLDETLVQHGRTFNLGIHDYGQIYEPRGHKYIVDFSYDPYPSITYEVGGLVFKKSFVFVYNKNQIIIKYTLVDANSETVLRLKPFLAFRATHALTHANTDAKVHYKVIDNGVSYKLYNGFPDLCIQISKRSEYIASPDWYRNVTYREEYRRGFDCQEDLFVPGYFEMPISKGESIYFSASLDEEVSSKIASSFANQAKRMPLRNNYLNCLQAAAHQTLAITKERNALCAGFSWLPTGALRESCIALPGVTLYCDGDVKRFVKILDDLIDNNQDALFRSCEQVEAPLRLTEVIQHYIEFADEAAVWKKYGKTLKAIVSSFISGREEVKLHDNGLLWAKKEGVALTWMNTYVDGKPVNERAGYQIETNCFWYNALKFVSTMESKYGRDKKFVAECNDICSRIELNFLPVFWTEERQHLADYVDENGQNIFTRPSQVYACSLKYSPIAEEYQSMVLKAIKKELLTSRGIRTLSPKNPKYKGDYNGNQIMRDISTHNGSTRPWLLGPYVEARFKLYGAAFLREAQQLVSGFEEDMNIHGIGAVCEMYDGDPSHKPHGAINSALSDGEILRVFHLIEKYKEVEQ